MDLEKHGVLWSLKEDFLGVLSLEKTSFLNIQTHFLLEIKNSLHKYVTVAYTNYIDDLLMKTTDC